jgi:flagellar motor switch protein FliG
MVLATGEEKAAILLKSLPAQAAESVLAQLGPERSNRLRDHMNRLEQSPGTQELVDQVLREFEDLLRIGGRPPVEVPETGDGEPPAATPPAAENGHEAEPAEGQPAEVPGDPMVALRQLSPDRLAIALQGEHPRTVSLVLNYLTAEQAGDVLKRLPPDLRRDASVQLSQGLQGDPDVLQRIVQALVYKSQTLGEYAAVQHLDARLRKIAEMLRSLERADRLEILAALEEHDPDTAAGVREHLYHFEDLLLVEDRSVQKLLTVIDSKNLALALKAASEEITEKVLSNLSKRARDALVEEMELLGSVSSVQIQQAQKAVVEAIQRVDEAGELIMKE